MLWSICRPGTSVVHDEGGNWVATFRDSKTAESSIAEHNYFHNRCQKSNQIDVDKVTGQELPSVSNTIQTTESNNALRWTKRAVW